MTSNNKYINVLDSKRAINSLRRANYKMMYFNKHCYYALSPSEIENINAMLIYLYNDYVKYKDDKKHVGVKVADLVNAFTYKNKSMSNSIFVARNTIYKLVPMFVNVVSGKKSRSARLFSLNERGMKLIELLILDKENGGYVKEKDIDKNIDGIDNDEVADDNVEAEDDI
jgi:hypothetical protein